MSVWSRGGWYTPALKKPPPERGIRMKKAGTTWWGQRWIGALETVLRGDSGRLGRGRTYARAGRTHDLVVVGSKVTAKVTGSRATPYKVTIELARMADVAWKRAIAGMARKAQFAAELLAGQMPKGIDEVFLATGTTLFPGQRAELVTSCSCPDWGDPCKHVAATHYVLGEAIDRDPFLLFELRGRTKSQVLDALRAERAERAERGDEPVQGAEKGAEKAAGKGRSPRGKKAPCEVEPPATEVPSVAFGKVELADYDRARQALPALQFVFDAPFTSGTVLRQLGIPSAWGASGSPADALSPLVRRAAEEARRIAMAEPDVHAAPGDGEGATKASGRRQKPRSR